MLPIPRSRGLTKDTAYATTMSIARDFSESYLLEEDWERDPVIYNHCDTRSAAIEA